MSNANDHRGPLLTTPNSPPAAAAYLPAPLPSPSLLNAGVRSWWPPGEDQLVTEDVVQGGGAAAACAVTVPPNLARVSQGLAAVEISRAPSLQVEPKQLPCAHGSFWGCWNGVCPRVCFLVERCGPVEQGCSLGTLLPGLWRRVAAYAARTHLGGVACVSREWHLAVAAPSGRPQLPFKAGVATVEREDRLAALDGVYNAGLEFERLDEVSPFPLPAGGDDQLGWIVGRAMEEWRARRWDDAAGASVGAVKVGQGAALSVEEPEVSNVTLPPGRVEYRSISAAQQDPRWGTPDSGGLCEAVASEIERVVHEFEVMKLVSAATMHAARRNYGRLRVEVLKLVLLITMKRSPTTGEETRAKARLALQDLVCLGIVKEKYSSVVAMSTVKYVANVTLGRRGRLYTLDVAGAYLHGRPLQPKEGGRVIFAKVPPGFEQFGFPERDSATGKPNYFQVTGNLPGRQDAGLIWQVCNDEFLTSFGFVQSEVERRCFIYHDKATDELIAFAQQLSVNFKRSTWAKILRWAKYIIDTAEDNVLTFSAPPEVGAWRASSDSSCINAQDEEGLLGPSFAAWTLHFEGSAPFDHGCMVLRGLGQATAHSELRAMAYVAKIAIALRMLAREMGFAPDGPTILLGDSKAALEGSLLDKTKRQERFLAAQKGMLRLWVRSKVFRFVRVPGYALRPDINTKTNFTREEFERLAYWVQSGVPRGDDKQLMDAEMTLQGVLAEPARISVVRVADHHVSWESPFPEHWPVSFVDSGAKSSGVGDHRGDVGSEAHELVLQQRIVRKQKKQLRAAAGDAQRLMAVIKQEKSLVAAAEARAAARIKDAEDAAARQVARAAEEVRAARHVARTLTGQLKAAHQTA